MRFNDIEILIEKEDWPAARKAINKELRSEPDDHWLLTRLALTYYEERKYTKALIYDERALNIAPKCPLVLWGYAGTLQMLARYCEAIVIYRGLIRRGVKRIAYGKCGEGLARARGLIADCWYRLSLIYEDLGDHSAMHRALVKHLKHRGPGCHSIYPLREVRKMFKDACQKRRGSGY